MAERKFYRTTITIDVLSEETPLDEDMTLTEIDYVITEGDCVGGNLSMAVEELTREECAEALTAMGSEPGFFDLLDEDEEDE